MGHAILPLSCRYSVALHVLAYLQVVNVPVPVVSHQNNALVRSWINVNLYSVLANRTCIWLRLEIRRFLACSSFFSSLTFATALYQIHLLVKVILSSHSSLSQRTLDSATSFMSRVACSSSGWSSSSSVISLVSSLSGFVEIVKVIKHKIHIFLLLSLQMMNNSVVLMHFYSDVSISLSRYSSWFNEIRASLSIFLSTVI